MDPGKLPVFCLQIEWAIARLTGWQFWLGLLEWLVKCAVSTQVRWLSLARLAFPWLGGGFLAARRFEKRLEVECRGSSHRRRSCLNVAPMGRVEHQRSPVLERPWSLGPDGPDGLPRATRMDTFKFVAMDMDK